MKAVKLPNTFLIDGEIVFVNEVEWDSLDLIERDRCESIVETIEQKYNTTSLSKMINKNISRKEMMEYIYAKHDLIKTFKIEQGEEF